LKTWPLIFSKKLTFEQIFSNKQIACRIGDQNFSKKSKGPCFRKNILWYKYTRNYRMLSYKIEHTWCFVFEKRCNPLGKSTIFVFLWDLFILHYFQRSPLIVTLLHFFQVVQFFHVFFPFFPKILSKLSKLSKFWYWLIGGIFILGCLKNRYCKAKKPNRTITNSRKINLKKWTWKSVWAQSV